MSGISHAQLNHLVDSGHVKKLVPLKTPLSKCVPYSKFNSWSPKRQLAQKDTVILVIDGAKWVASTAPLNEDGTVPNGVQIYSGDGKELVGIYSNKRTFGEYRLVESGDDSVAKGLTSQTYVTLYTYKNNPEEEEKSMSNLDPNEFSMEALKAELQQTGEQQPAGGAPMASATAFNAAPAPANTGNKEATPMLNDKIRSILDKTEIADPSAVQLFNRQFGSLDGYVTNFDSRIEFNLRKKVVTRDGRKVLDQNAPEHVQQAHNLGQPVDNQYFKYEYRLGVRQTRPGKILLVAISIPVGGFIPNYKFRESGPALRPDDTNKDIKKILLPEAAYATFLGQYFGRGIKENPKTHGSYATEVRVETVLGSKRVKGETTKTALVRRRLKAAGRSSLIVPGNYLPLKTYRTVEYSPNLNEEQLNVLNRSAFHSIVNANQGSAAATKFELLNEEDAAKVTRVDDKTVKSRFFTANAAERVPLEVKPFYDSNADALTKLEIPVKVEVPKKGDSGEYNFRYDTINTLDEAHLKDPQKAQFASLNNPKFKPFIEVVGEDLLNVENLSALTRRAGRTGGSKKTIDNETLLKLEMGYASNLYDSSLLEIDGIDQDSIKAVNDQIYSLQLSVAGETK